MISTENLDDSLKASFLFFKNMTASISTGSSVSIMAEMLKRQQTPFPLPVHFWRQKLSLLIWVEHFLICPPNKQNQYKLFLAFSCKSTRETYRLAGTQRETSGFIFFKLVIYLFFKENNSFRFQELHGTT